MSLIFRCVLFIDFERIFYYLNVFKRNTKDWDKGRGLNIRLVQVFDDCELTNYNKVYMFVVVYITVYQYIHKT